ncbi:MAG: hypothetical protein U0Y82_15115 [Thermoleophilia bacterium]
MSKLFLVIGVFALLIFLTTSGVVGAGVCMKGFGCLYSTGDGIRLDNSGHATIGTR